MSLTSWTTEQLLSLAPDSLMARAAERIANPYEWVALGHSSEVMWGEYPNNNNVPYRTFATLPDLAFYCDCPARKRPCRHALSLAFMAVREEAFFQEAAPPPWVQQNLDTWIQGGSEFVYRQPPASKTPYEEQLQSVKEGMQRFERWLKDVVHRGLAGVPSMPVALWNEMASRLADSGAPEVAQEVRELRLIAGSHPGWPEVMLRHLGRLYLLTQGFAEYDNLPPESQADLRGAAGWFEDPSHPGEEKVEDHWLVLGSTHTMQRHHNLRRTWFYGLNHRRFAFVSQISQQEMLKPIHFSATAVEATLRFAPGGWPQRASIIDLKRISPDNSPVSGYKSLQNARTAYGKGLSVNPWLRNFPLVLVHLLPEPDGDRWVLRDGKGFIIPLPKSFMYGWHLQAMGSAAGSAIFGEWDGVQFLPLSVYHKDGWLTLSVLRGQK
jgi:hypothetical protein